MGNARQPIPLLYQPLNHSSRGSVRERDVEEIGDGGGNVADINLLVEAGALDFPAVPDERHVGVVVVA